ncbi:MAG: rod shape-determining protein MreD [Nitrospirae bacterium]|nr:rod shape-determining protein MreD [Nitrospirota bacterium]
MRIILWPLFLIVVAAFQGSIANPIEAGGIRPDLILITVYFTGMFRGEVRGGLTGTLLGIFLDITSAAPVYSNVFLKSFIGYVAGVIGRWVHNPGYFLHTVIIFLISLIQGLTVFIIFLFLGTAQFPSDILYIALPQAVFDGVLGGVLYLLISFLSKQSFQVVRS